VASKRSFTAFDKSDLRDSMIARDSLARIESGEEELPTSEEADELLSAKSRYPSGGRSAA
jgi:hypothetical protein